MALKEAVLIILNEREPAKQKTAEILELQLQQSGLSSARLPVTDRIIDIVLQREPSLLVLDYLLGDYSTGLDIMAALQSLAPDSRPKTVFLTDEPGVSVAVEAMRLGAVDYIDIEHPQAINRTLRCLLELKATHQKNTLKTSRPQLRLDDMALSSGSGQVLLREAKAAAFAPAPLIIVEGPAGSGKNALARAIALERKPLCPYSTIDLRLHAAPKHLHHSNTLIIEHPEEDDGTFVSSVIQQAVHIWPDSRNESACFLTVCCTTPETSSIWQQVTDHSLLRLPSLDQRREDIPMLVRQIMLEVQQGSTVKPRALTASNVEWLAGLPWPGELDQLKACVARTAIESTFEHYDFKQSVEHFQDLWLEEHNGAGNVPPLDPLHAAMMLEIAGHNYQKAAAGLGCSIKDLYQALK